jgi:hypothetical protein
MSKKSRYKGQGRPWLIDLFINSLPG